MKKVMTAAFSAMVFAGTVVTAQAEKQAARPSQAVSAAHSTCTGLKSACLSGKDCYSTGVESAPNGGLVGGPAGTTFLGESRRIARTFAPLHGNDA
jgi:hypothetical protein